MDPFTPKKPKSHTVQLKNPNFLLFKNPNPYFSDQFHFISIFFIPQRSMSLYQAPGFRFHPTDEEIVCFYLKRKLTGKLPSCFDHLAVIDIYKFEPWDLPSM